jgi:hypothetical protein
VNEKMMLEPKPWETYWPHMFRLAGFGGAALFMRTVLISTFDDSADGAHPQFALDISTLSPHFMNNYLARFSSPDFVDRLSTFLFTAAAQWHPEVSVASFQDERLGLEISITTSTESVVGVVVKTVQDLEDEIREFDTLDFETTRSALAQASFDVRQLNGIGEPPDGDVYFGCVEGLQ